MQITITPSALNWFKEAFTIPEGMGIRFYGKVYGTTNKHEGFSVGLNIDSPSRPLVEFEQAGIRFFIDENDDWFFKDLDLTVDFDEKSQVPTYTFTETK